MDKKLKEVAAYVRTIVDYDDRLKLALNKMDRMRCSLRFADSELFDEIVEKVQEWCDDNEYSLDFFEDYDELIEGDEGLIWVE